MLARLRHALYCSIKRRLTPVKTEVCPQHRLSIWRISQLLDERYFHVSRVKLSNMVLSGAPTDWTGSPKSKMMAMNHTYVSATHVLWFPKVIIGRRLYSYSWTDPRLVELSHCLTLQLSSTSSSLIVAFPASRRSSSSKHGICRTLYAHWNSQVNIIVHCS